MNCIPFPINSRPQDFACRVCAVVAVSLATLGAWPLYAEDDAGEKSSVPPGVSVYMGREVAQTMHYAGAPWLIRESRQREEDCERMLSHLGVRKGMTVCDMGCGNGFYSLQLATMVGPSGRVLAVDIQPEMLKLLLKLVNANNDFGRTVQRSARGAPVTPIP